MATVYTTTYPFQAQAIAQMAREAFAAKRWQNGRWLRRACRAYRAAAIQFKRAQTKVPKEAN